MTRTFARIDIIKGFVKIIPNLPTMLYGMYLGKYISDKKNVGLAWIFNKSVKRNPNGVAILYNNKSYTYKELDEWSNKIGNLFLSKGLKKGDTIALFMENRPEYLAVALGGAKTGIGIALINNSQIGKVLVHSLNLINPKLIVVGSELIQNFLDIRSELTTDKDFHYLFNEYESQTDAKGIEMKDMVADIQQSKSDSLQYIWSSIVSKDPLFYIYTSGTTGLPKAAKFNNGRYTKVYSLFGHITMRYKRSDIIYVCLPLYHATGLASAWSAVLKASATIVIDKKFSATKFWSIIKQYKATSFAYVGELCNYLMAQEVCEDEKNNTIKSVVGNGMRLSIWSKFKERFQIDKIGEFYASSEGNVAFSNIFNHDHTCGFSGIPFKIVEYDREKDEPVRYSNGLMKNVAKGEVGLLIGEIAKASPFDGYTQKDKKDKSILRNCFKNGDAYFNTGDLVMNQGFKHMHFVDRTGDTFRWKGQNVSTTEVENIMTDFDRIDEVVVYGVTMPHNNGKAGMANIIVHDKNEFKIDFSLLLNHLKKNLASYSIPLFIRISDNVLTTGTYKHSKAKLKEEEYYLEKVGKDKIYVLLPKSDTYIELTEDIQNKILSGEISF